MRYVNIFVFLILLTITFPTTAAAQNCQPLFGGGITEEEYCPDKPAPQPQKESEKTQQPTSSKGGLPVNKPVTTDRTPDTGPALFGLLSLLPVGALGVYLRHKARA